MTSDEMLNKINEAGIDNCLFLVPMRPVKKFLFLSYTSSSDEEVVVPCIITEENYELSDHYKITLKSIYTNFGKENFYISDLSSLINRGIVKMFTQVKGK